jgi:hypothetical protein
MNPEDQIPTTNDPGHAARVDRSPETGHQPDAETMAKVNEYLDAIEATPRFAMTFGTSNAAFSPESGPEIARILRRIADLAEEGYTSGLVHDENGNGIGTWRITG